MGLRPLAPANWLWLDGRYDTEVALRRELLDQRRDEVFQACPEAHAASTEILELVLTFLETQHLERFQQIQEDKSLAPGQTTFEMAVRNGHRVFKNFWQVDLAQDFVSLPKDVQSDWSISPVVILALSFVKFTQELR